HRRAPPLGGPRAGGAGAPPQGDAARRRAAARLPAGHAAGPAAPARVQRGLRRRRGQPARRELGARLAARGRRGPPPGPAAAPAYPLGVSATERLAPGTGIPPPGTVPGDQIARLGEALASFATGVTLVMVADGRDDIGTTVSAFCPVSWSPPLVLVSLIADSYPAEVLGRVDRFAV